MIQRIQSLFLLLSSTLYLVYWYYGLEWYLEGFNVIKNLPFLAEKNTTLHILDPLIFITTYAPLTISLLCSCIAPVLPIIFVLGAVVPNPTVDENAEIPCTKN